MNRQKDGGRSARIVPEADAPLAHFADLHGFKQFLVVALSGKAEYLNKIFKNPRGSV